MKNLANLGGLRARLSLKQAISDYSVDDEECRPWRRRLFMAFTWGSALRITLLFLLLAAVVTACFTFPIEKVQFFSSGSLSYLRFEDSLWVSWDGFLVFVSDLVKLVTGYFCLDFLCGSICDFLDFGLG